VIDETAVSSIVFGGINAILLSVMEEVIHITPYQAVLLVVCLPTSGCFVSGELTRILTDEFSFGKMLCGYNSPPFALYFHNLKKHG
jgi:hypothetical protein